MLSPLAASQPPLPHPPPRRQPQRPPPHRRQPNAAPLKIAFAYVGPVGDAGWTFAHDQGRKAIEAEFGDKMQTVMAENVPESADAERVIRQFATDGAKMVFGTTFGYMDPMLKVAGDFKDVKFEHATGFKTGDNMRTYDSRTYEGAYMAGVIAGKMTKSNTLGVVGSIPIPEVIRNINSFTMGAQTSKPEDQDQGGVDRQVVRPAEGRRSRAEPDQPRRRRAVPEHRLRRRAANRREEQQARFRLGQRHEPPGERRAPGLGHHRLGAVLQVGREVRAGRHMEDAAGVVGRQRRRHRHGEDRPTRCPPTPRRKWTRSKRA